jgi:hypothetical protein
VNFGDLAVMKSVFFQSCPTPPRFDDGGIHDKDNRYFWSTGTNNPDGTASTVLQRSIVSRFAFLVSAPFALASFPAAADRVGAVCVPLDQRDHVVHPAC